MQVLGKWLAFCVLLILSTTQLIAQNFSSTKDGLKYKYLVKSDSGEVVGVGGYLEMHVVVQTHLKAKNKDTILSSTYNSTKGASRLLVRPATYKGCINNGFAMLKTGDSVIFRVIADSLFRKTFVGEVPPFLTGKEEVNIITKVIVGQAKETFQKKLNESQENKKKAAQEQLAKELNQLKQEAKRLGVKGELQSTLSGVFYTKLTKTDSLTATRGQKAGFFYRGTLIGGRVFDTNYGKNPFKVTIGSGGVIEGWLQVVDKIRLGEKWMIFVPSNLAYGKRGMGSILPDTPLIFEMELATIEK